MDKIVLSHKAEDEKLYNKVLIAGPDYRNHFGGIGAVIDSYRIRFPYFNFFPTYKSTKKYFKPFYSIKQILLFPWFLLGNPKFKIIHIHGSSFGSFYRKYLIFLISKYLFSRKVIYHIHGSEYQLFCDNAGIIKFKLISHFINHTDVLICLSEKWKEYFLANFKPIRIEVLKNYIDTKQIAAFDKQKNSSIVFLFLGKIGKRKGTFDVLEVVNEIVRAGNKNFKIWFGGDGEVEKLKEFIASNQLEDTVSYLGWVSGEKKAEILRLADIYILPSYNEGMPISILEAMAHSMPVISSNVGGIPELVKDNLSGILIDPGDLRALKKAMEYFMEHSHEITNMGKKGFEIIAQFFTAEIAMEKLFSIYQQLLVIKTNQ